MTTQHTPGPWRVAEQRERGGTRCVYGYFYDPRAAQEGSDGRQAN